MGLLTNIYGYYKLDEPTGSAIDSSVNGRNMANFASAIGSSTGIINTSRLYPGTQAYFTGGASTNFAPGTQHFSFSVWVNLGSLAYAGGSGDVGIISKTGTADNKEYILWFQSGGDKKWHFFCSNDGVTSGATVTWATAPLVNTWYHITGGYDGANVWLSVNAATRITAPMTGSIPVGNVGFQLGFEGGSSAPLTGKIDEFGFWIGRDLTPAEVTQLYNGGVGLAFAAFGGTVRPSNGTPTDIQTIHNSAACVDGDIITMPTGSFVWDTGITITKGISLIGNTTTNSVAGTANDLTNVLDSDARRRSGGWPFIVINSVAGKSYRISGLTFDAGGASVNNNNGAVVFTGTSTSIRIDNTNWHANIAAVEAVFNQLSGTINGVADHNIYKFGHAAASFHCDNGQTTTEDGGGDVSFSQPSNFGTDKFFFIEDNYFDGRPNGVTTGGPDDLRGGRWVWRYNHLYDTQVQSHGTEDGRWHGGRAREIYNNDFHFTTLHGVGGSRSGVTLFYNNTVDGIIGQAQYTLEAYRCIHKWPASPFFGANGSVVYDVNATRIDGTNHPGEAPFVFESGTATSTTGANTVQDTSKSWTTNQWANYSVRYTGPNFGDDTAIIDSNTSNTLTLDHWGADAGGPRSWTTGDTFSIYKVLIAMDQPGRGQGDLLIDAKTFVTVATTVNNTPSTVQVNSTAAFPATGTTLLLGGKGPVAYTGKTSNSFTGCTGAVGAVAQGSAGNLNATMVLDSVTGTATWPNQVLDPCYSWNNVFTPTSTQIDFVPGASGVTLQSGRDFFNRTVKTGYTPYQYPHPLVTGTVPVANRNITLTGPGLAFGNVVIGSSSPTAPMTVSNGGDTLLTVTSVAYPNGFSGSTAGFTVAPGGSFDVIVTFTPLVAQLYSGTISVTSDATSGTGTIACSGTGVNPTPPVHGHRKRARDDFYF